MIDGRRQLADSLALTSDALMVVEAAPPHRVLHSSPSVYLVTGYRFHTRQHSPLASLFVDLEECVLKALTRGWRCCSLATIVDASTSDRFRVRLTSE